MTCETRPQLAKAVKSSPRYVAVRASLVDELATNDIGHDDIAVGIRKTQADFGGTRHRLMMSLKTAERLLAVSEKPKDAYKKPQAKTHE
jgi:hypothetical protein